MSVEERDYDYLSSYPALYEGRIDGLPDTCAWKSRLKNLFANRQLWEKIGVPDHGVYVLSGPAGNGRHMIASALIGEITAGSGADPSESGFLRYQADEFSDELSRKEALHLVDCAFDQSEDAELRILMFDDMECYGNLQAVCNEIVNNMDETENPPVIFCITGDDALLSRELLALSVVLRTGYPSEAQREAYLASRFEWEMPNPDDPLLPILASVSPGVTAGELAKETEDFSYAELGLLVQYILISSLNQLTEGSTFELYCGSDATKECLNLVKNRRQEKIPVIQVAGQTEQPAETAADQRATSLANKKNLTFAENLELIDLVLVNQGGAS